VFRGVAELRVKESDRLAGVVALVRAFGGEAHADGDDLVVQGVAALTPGYFDAGGDHRLVMAAAAGGLAAGGPTRVTGWEAVATSYPGFADQLQLLTGHSAAGTR